MELDNVKMAEEDKMEMNLCPCGKARHYIGSVYCSECGKKLNEKAVFPKWTKSKWKNVVKEFRR